MRGFHYLDMSDEGIFVNAAPDKRGARTSRKPRARRIAEWFGAPFGVYYRPRRPLGEDPFGFGADEDA